jgi:protein SCO1/2
MFLAGGSKNLNVLIASALTVFSYSSLAHDPARPWAKEGTVSTEMPAEFKDIGITEKNGDQIDPHITFKDEDGKTVEMGHYFSGKKPVILSMVYLECPNLCNMHLNGLNEGMKKLKWTAGDEFEVLSVSFNPKETPQEAKEKKETYLEAYGRPDGAKGWHFLTGEDSQIKKLANQIGFKYRWDESSKQYIHSTAAVLLTPDGKISRYLHGITFDPKTLRLSLVEASNGVIGSFVDHVVLFCFHYDPDKRSYAFYAYNLVRYAAAVCALMLFAFLFPIWRRMWKESRNR